MDPRFSGPGASWAGGPSNRQKSYASALQEHDSLIQSYEHLVGVPKPEDALERLRKIASLVKPIMRKRGWHVNVLAEFLPEDPRLLGLNINHGYKICVRLRYTNNASTFLPLEETVDTMLHELSHIVFGPHDANFHALWEELRDEHETLLMKGYTGEGFLTRGQRLGGGRLPPPTEIRRLARASAEKRRVLTKGSGQRLGGGSTRPGQDPRTAIVNAIERRSKMDRGCASGSADAGRLAAQATQQTFKTKAEENDANDRAIAEALLELMEEEETRKLEGTLATPPPDGGLGWTPENGLYTAEDARDLTKKLEGMSEEEQMRWALEDSTRSEHTHMPDRLPSTNGDMDESPAAPSHPARQAHSDSHSSDRSETRDQRSNYLHDIATPKIPNNIRSAKRHRPISLEALTSPQTTQHGNADSALPIDLTSDSPFPDRSTWTCEICTCINPLQYLACDACGLERPAPPSPPVSRALALLPRSGKLVKKRPDFMSAPTNQTSTGSLGWSCGRCGTFMEHKWWSCSACGKIKEESKEVGQGVIGFF